MKILRKPGGFFPGPGHRDDKPSSGVSQETWFERFDAALEHVKLAYYVVDGQGKVTRCNPAFRAWIALKDEDSIAEMSLPDLHAKVLAAYGGLVPDSTRADAFIQLVNAKAKASLNLMFQNGRILQLKHSPISDGGFVHTLEDVTERRRLEALANHRASYDNLTNLPNRRLFKQHIDVSLHDKKANYAVLCVSVNQFKSVNDAFGHSAGDALLKEVAARLQASVRTNDTLGRLGGNEFVVLVANIENKDCASYLANRIIQSISKPFDLHGHSVVVGASVGIALAPQDTENPDRLIKLADMARFSAKRESSSCYQFFEPALEARLIERQRLEEDLRTALARAEFELHYQPVFHASTRQLLGFEALLRWNHPSRGRVSPADFIPVAEELGLITPMGDWIIDQACQTLASWPEHLKVAVNVSARQFVDHDLMEVVRQALERHQIAPSRFEIEITESLLMESAIDLSARLRDLRNLGIGLAMDDFGTGYSSLAYLRKFHFSKVKIDRSFVSSLPGDAQSLAIVRAIVAMCKSLGLTITAEGVETAEQADALQNEGCEYLQGFGLGRPIPLNQASELVTKQPLLSA